MEEQKKYMNVRIVVIAVTNKNVVQKPKIIEVNKLFTAYFCGFLCHTLVTFSTKIPNSNAI